MKKRPKKTKNGRKPIQSSGHNSRAKLGDHQSERRKWCFRLVALIILPLLLLGGLELILRLAGYGYSTNFFAKMRIGEKEFLVDNENFSLRFFPPQLVRRPEPVKMEAAKPASTYRIFILGESAAMGDPKPAYGVGRYLEVMLSERYPKTHFEVVNVGITAIDSHVILPIARDCAKANSDLWIIYMGNNEMVGPFGAATVFGAKAPPLGFVRLNLAIQKTRIGQLIVDISRRLKGNNSNGSWGGMNMFVGNQLRADDPHRETVYRNFERNLSDIVSVGLDSGANILLNTMAVNLKDCPPFASLNDANLSASDSEQFEQLFSEACAEEARTNFTGALKKFERAAKIDPSYAELHYRWGECLLELTNLIGARVQFQAACDLDALPFRADSHINGAIQNIAARFAGSQLTLFDAASALGNNLRAGVCGQETFFEHVHFNFNGSYRLGRAWAEQVEKMLPADIANSSGTNGWVSREICDRMLGLTDWNRYAVTQVLFDRMQHPPLSGQENNAERIKSLQDDSRAFRGRMNPATAQQATEIYLSAINRSPQDYLLHENFAEFLESIADLNQAVAQWRQVQELLPYSCEPFYQSGRLFSELNQWPEAEAAFRKVVNLNPHLAEGWNDLGCADLAAGNVELALQDYSRAWQLDPQNASYCACVGGVYSKLNNHSKAIQLYRQAIQMQSDLWEAHFALGDEFANIGRIVEAEKEYAEVVRIKPVNAQAHLDKGMMMARLGQIDVAMQEFNETLRLEPHNRQAQECIEQTQDLKNRGR